VQGYHELRADRELIACVQPQRCAVAIHQAQPLARVVETNGRRTGGGV
jgi:hypothetical protein